VSPERRPPAHVAPYVEVLGPDLAVDLLSELGGSEVYLPAVPAGGSRIAEIVGLERLRALIDRVGPGKRRVPLAKPWIAQVLRARGLPVAAIARRLSVSDVTVRSYLQDPGAGRHDPRQRSLF
jgi:hypothetical protein